MRKFIVFVVFLAFSLMASAQADSTYPTPEFSRQPYFFDQLSKQLIPLEKAIARMKTRYAMMGAGSFGYIIEEPTSRVTLVAANRSQFIVTDLSSGLMDPAAMMPLFRLKTGKKQREIVMGMGGRMDDSEKVDFELKKIGEKYIFVLLQPLPPGEYAFVNMMSMGQSQTVTAYCFKVR